MVSQADGAQCESMCQSREHTRAFGGMCQVETQNIKVMNMKMIMDIKYGAELIIAHTQVCHLMHRLVSMQQAAPAAVPAANPGPLVAPAHAPLAAAQAPAPLQRSAVDRRATVVDGVLQLQGPEAVALRRRTAHCPEISADSSDAWRCGRQHQNHGHRAGTLFRNVEQ